MSAEENMQLMRRWFQEVWNEGKIQTVYDLLSPDAIGKGQTGGQDEIHGPKDFVPFVERIRNAFPDIHVTIEDALAVPDKVAVRWSATMTHSGAGLGLPATGKPVLITGITIARIVDGQIIEGWDNWDQLAMLQQIGAYQPETVMLAKTA
jgi:steroid delta-isomerase-like uncharacterized protein